MIATGIAVLFAIIPTAASAGSRIRDPADSAGPIDFSSARLKQKRRSVVFAIHTRGNWKPGLLDRTPQLRGGERFACLSIGRVGQRKRKLLCLGGHRIGKHSRLGISTLKGGVARRPSTVPANVDRVGFGDYRVSLRPEDARLDPGRYRWRMMSGWSGPACGPGSGSRAGRAEGPALPCYDRAPDRREVRFRLRRMQPIGCRDSGPSPVLHGSRSRKRVALTFDDGPSAYTPKILDVLRRKHALGTFFDLGAQIPGKEKLLRSILRGGHELANHSLAHQFKPSRASMAATSARIEEASGFRPCLFRPPYGAYDSRVVGDASSLGMTTVNWDVDPQDWTTPGSEAIYQRVVSKTRPGSIVLMHDGGGDRSQTVAALPRIIRKLRHRGYRFTTVSRLLGQRVTWGPVHRSDRRGLRSAATRLDPRLEALTPPSETEDARRWRRVSGDR